MSLCSNKATNVDGDLQLLHGRPGHLLQVGRGLLDYLLQVQQVRGDHQLSVCLSELTSKSNNLYVWLDNWMLLVINKPMINDSLLLFFKTSLIFIQNSLGRKISKERMHGG